MLRRPPKPPPSTLALRSPEIPHGVPISPEQLAVLAPLIESANRYAASSKAPRTRHEYEADFRAFKKWCDGKKLPSLPTNPSVVALYLTSLADAGRKPSTITRAYSGIVHAQRASGHEWPRGNQQIADILSGIRRELKGSLKKKTAMSAEHLARIVDGLDLENFLGQRDRAVLCLGWTGAFRRSELVALNVEDVTFCPEGLRVLVHSSKTDQEGVGALIGIPFANNQKLCAVEAVRTIIVDRTSGPLFTTRTGRRLRGQAIAMIVQRAARRVSLELDFAAHSLRSGFATTAAEHGVELHGIMRQGRWKTAETALGYIRPTTVFKNNAAKGIL